MARCHDILRLLPTRENLHKMKIITDPVCPLCGYMVEIGFHILWQCPAILDVWDMEGVKFQKSNFTGPRFLQVVECMFRKCDNEEMTLFAGLARCIWLRRNDVLHRGIFSHPQVILSQATQALDDFKKAQVDRDDDMQNREYQWLSYWMAPSSG